ncbi:hypothetical protein J41TS12_47290 [Paenibacillus antibioticophila]|uniref:Uncharacterized protein n=1 Tax=Paenibacillus antibioticophila TaxID=1274374 RepID=A0A920CJN8_9BACL|nr:hypothetical protein J41TS12_47290 [Paenibacillus antibioticophila]
MVTAGIEIQVQIEVQIEPRTEVQVQAEKSMGMRTQRLYIRRLNKQRNGATPLPTTPQRAG